MQSAAIQQDHSVRADEIKLVWILICQPHILYKSFEMIFIILLIAY